MLKENGIHGSTTLRPGALTALLGELARAPDATGWSVPAAPGERIGRFEIVREIGRGGFGVVYEAKDTELGRSVAFKAIRAGATDAARDQRALAEAEAAARLAHPNIVHLYDVGRCRRGAFLILELLRGESLDDRLQRGPFKLREAVHVATEIARGLAHAHEQGVVHRDLKPANVFLCDDGQVKVLDFGLAHVFGRGGIAGGTPDYMAPEQARGDPTDERADVYALGVIVHELVTGKRPPPPGERLPLLPEESSSRSRLEHARRGVADGGEAPPLPGAPRALAKLATRMLARDPAERLANGGEAHAQLVLIQKALEPRRARLAWAVAVVAVLAAAGLALRPRPPPLPPGRLLVGIADVANTSGDLELDAASELLGAALEQSRRVSILARSRLLGLLRAPDGSRPSTLDERGVRDAARRAGAHAVIVPAVRPAGTGYDLEARAVDLSRDEPLFTLRERAGGKGAVPGALDRLAERVRSALQEDPKGAPAAAVALSRMVPASPEAWRLYAKGQRLESAGQLEEGRRAYEEALEVDPEFPLAHVRLAQILWLRDGDAVRRHLDAALRALDRVPPKERELVEARRAFLELRGGDAIVHYDRVISGWPQDPAAYAEAGDLVMKLWGGVEMARPYLEKALALDAIAEHDAIEFLVALGRTDEALARATRWAEATPAPVSLRQLSFVHAARGEATKALEARRRALAQDPQPPRPRWSDPWIFLEAGAEDEAEALYRRTGTLPWSWLAVRGRRREALAALDAAGRDGPAAARGRYHAVRGDVVWGEGRPELVWREAMAALELGQFAANCLRAPLAHLGDLARAARLDALWQGSDPRDHCVRTYHLVRAWKTGDRETALRGFADMFAGFARYHRGEILQELGRDREAVELFRLYRRLPSWGAAEAATWMYPRSLYLQALSHERLGERGEALRTVDRLLRLWKGADPDLPDLVKAKALRKRLAAASVR